MEPKFQRLDPDWYTQSNTGPRSTKTELFSKRFLGSSKRPVATFMARILVDTASAKQMIVGNLTEQLVFPTDQVVECCSEPGPLRVIRDDSELRDTFSPLLFP